MTERPAEAAITILVPDIERLSDEEIADVAFHRDGRWSAQTKSLMTQFGVTRLDLNRGWASTWTGWTCACCGRTKPQIVRVTAGGVLLCRLELHHDHLVDRVKALYREALPRSDDRLVNNQNDHARGALIALVERFERTVICIDCNLAEGRVKLALAEEIPREFTFAPSEIAAFITVASNRTHEVDVDKARDMWHARQPELEDRLDFVKRMIQRVGNGRHRREPSTHRQQPGPLNDGTFVYQLFLDVAPRKLRYLGMQIEARSLSNDTAGTAVRPKQKPSVMSDAEFAVVDEAMQGSRPWADAGPDWSCPCCGRSKRTICRKSNTGRWTARIHRLSEYEEEYDLESLARRRLQSSSQTVVGGYRSLLICQDCRHISGEVQRRHRGLSQGCLTVANLSELVADPVPHAAHAVDYVQAISMANSNTALVEAIEDYREHCALARRTRIEFKLLRKQMGWSAQECREYIGYEYAKLYDWDHDETDTYVSWLLAEGDRIERLDRQSWGPPQE